MTQKVGVCDVCFALNGDDSQKDVTWCRPCGKWKCDRCMRRPLRSVRAILKKAVSNNQE